jgi:hypothetical protein
MNHASEILDRKTDILAFLKTRFPLYDKSNVFFRDIQYGIQVFLGRKGIKAGYPESEKIAREFASLMEREGVFVAIDRQSWALHYPEFRTPPSKPAPVAPVAHSVAPHSVAPHSVAPRSVVAPSVAPPKPSPVAPPKAPSEQESV